MPSGMDSAKYLRAPFFRRVKGPPAGVGQVKASLLKLVQWHAEMIPSQRQDSIRTIGVLVVMIALGGTIGWSGQPVFHLWDPWLGLVASVSLLGAVLLTMLRLLTFDMLATIICMVTAAALFIWQATLQFDDTQRDEVHGVFMSVHLTMSAAFLLFMVLLPYPRSARYASVAWLGSSAIVTAGSLPYWAETPSKIYLLLALLYVWVGQGLFLILLFGWARQRSLFLQAQPAVSDAAIVADHERQQATARLQLIFEQGTAGIGLIDADARWLEVNARLAEMLGYRRDQMLGASLFDRLPDSDQAASRSRMLPFLTGREADCSELRVESIWLHRDGSPAWMSGHVRRIEDGLDPTARAVVTLIDVSDRVRAEAEAALRQRHEAFHFEHLPMAMIEWDWQLRVIRWSRQAEVMLGWPAEAVVGRTLHAAGVIDDEAAEVHASVMRQFLSGARSAAESLLPTRHRDGRQVWFRWFSHCLIGADGRPESFFTAGLDVSELLENNLGLAKSRSELQALFEQAGVGIAMLDEKGRWLTVNRRLCEIVARSEAELLVRDFRTFVHPDDLRRDIAQARQLAAGEISGYAVEKRLCRPDGSTVWVRAHVGRIDAAEGRAMRFLTVVEDVSEQKQAEQRAAEHAEVREFHFENTPLAAIEWSPDFRVQRWSRRAAEMYGWTEAEVLDCPLADWRFIHDDDLATTRAAIDRMMSGGARFAQIMNRNYHKDGRSLWCQWHNSVLRDASGTPRSVFSLVKDVSEEQFTIAALRDSQARFQSIFEQAAVGIVMIDGHGNWLMVNRRFREIVGYGADELMQRSCEAITETDDLAAELALRRQLIAGTIDDYSFEKRYLRPDGTPVWVSVHARRLDDADADGLPPAEVRLTLVVVDITERRQAEADLRRLNVSLESRVARRTEQLNDAVRGWAQRNEELSMLGEMMALLPAAQNLGESSRIIERFLPKILARCAGAVWLQDQIAGRLSLIGTWGSLQDAPMNLSRDDCWATRRGQLLRVDDPADPLCCPHLHDRYEQGRQRPHVCVPVMALGDTVGLIHLEWSGQINAAETPPDPVLLRNVAEQVGLAVGNVQLREELRRQAIRDALTGLYNRRHFEEVLKARIAEHARNGRGFALLMIDIDHFKRVNDEHGHDIGDEVLREAGSLLLRTVRSDESVFRLGGEEFVMIVDDSDGSGHQAAGCAERVRRETEALRVQRRGRELPSITVSVGLARYPQDVPMGGSPMQRADAALYAAKRTGRNRVCMAGAMAGHDGIAGSVK